MVILIKAINEYVSGGRDEGRHTGTMSTVDNGCSSVAAHPSLPLGQDLCPAAIALQ